MKQLAALLLSLATSLPMTAGAEEFRTRLFGHDVQIAKEDPEDVLAADGEELHRQIIVTFGEITTIGGIGVAVGSSSGGGNSCDSSPFVLAFPADRKPRLDGPLDTCGPTSHRIETDRIVFETRPRPLRPGDRWVWTAEHGFGPAEKVPHVAESRSGWPVLGARQIDHPATLFDFADTANAVNALAGRDRETFIHLLDVGSAEFDGDFMVGSAFSRLGDPDGNALLVADIPARKVFIAWKVAGKPVVARPAAGEWPQKARRHLREWERERQ